MSALTTLSSVLRLLMLALLIAGVLVKPVLAVECEIRGAQQLAVGEQQTATSEVSAPDSDGDCCLVQNCNDCCAHTIALQAPLGGAPAVPMSAALRPALSVDFEPIAFPVAFRPPITA